MLYTKDSLYLVFEYLDYDLKKYLKSRSTPPTPAQVKVTHTPSLTAPRSRTSTKSSRASTTATRTG